MPMLARHLGKRRRRCRLLAGRNVPLSRRRLAGETPKPLTGTVRATAIRLRDSVGALRGFVAPLDAAPVCRSATDSSALESERAQEGESPSLAELPARN